MVGDTRNARVEIRGHLDNQAVEQAVNKGHSLKLGHLKKHAEVILRLLQESGVEPIRTPGPENTADVFTKALGRLKHQHLIVTCSNGSIRSRIRLAPEWSE